MDVWLQDRDGGNPAVLRPGEWLSLSWTDRWARPDSMTMEMPLSVAVDAAVAKGRVVTFTDAGVERVYVIDQVTSTGDEQGRVSELVTVAAVCPVGARSRVVMPTSGQSHDVMTGVAGETAVKGYIARNLGADASASRRLPQIVVAPDQVRGKTGTWRGRYQPLVDFLEGICLTTGVRYLTSWDRSGEAPSIVVDCYAGEDLRGSVLVDDASGTLRREEVHDTDVERVTFVYVGGQGIGVNRVIEPRWLGINDGEPEPTDWARWEDFRDARDTDSVETLRVRGDERIAEASPEAAIEAELTEQEGFRYGTDWNVADLLAYRSRLGFSRFTRVVEVVTTLRDTGVPSRTVVLDRPWPSSADRARVTGGTDYE